MYDELAKALRGCVLPNPCDGCPYYDTNGPTRECATMNIAAADAIEELVGFVQEAERDRDEYRERLDKANDAIEELIRKEKFHAFLWNTIQPNEMEQYKAMYRTHNDPKCVATEENNER